MNQIFQYSRLALVLLSVMAGIVMSCARKQPEDVPLTFAFVPGVADPFYYAMERGARQMAEALGITFIVSDYPATWGPRTQISVLDTLAAREKIDAILIAPTSVDALTAPLKAFATRGIPIITVDTFLGDGDYSKSADYAFPLSYIGTDNELGGKKIAENLARLLGESGKVYVNTTNADVSSVEGRVKGFLAGIAEFPNMEVVKVDYCLDVQDVARAQTLHALQTNPDIVGVFGTNVFSAQGAYQAVVETGLTGAVKIAAWDATPDLIGALRDGHVDLVLAQKPAEMGALAVEWAHKYITHQAPVPKKIISGFEFFTLDNVNEPAMQQFVYQ
ncbi:ABC transporter substrate binding protein (Ribose) [Candidatus Moduliflexus flocculans]|uniref:ABC transporter substrate binding protein (Ribose) n=1 Tax=Candidatus Moduliflexus flocculans TaxID=1499966 RepID=A0A081BNM1_9BACT|nr:ABC transporter substrate binding protein (Ribose) [Candidatus Moduliflexus flocculans]